MIPYLISGAVYGFIECYAMEHGFSTGVMDFYGFKRAYHGAMLFLSLSIGWGCGALDAFPLWVLVEDLSFWASSKWGPKKWGFTYKYKLTEDSWIAKKMGSFKHKRVLIPLVHPALLVIGVVSVLIF